MKKRINIQLYSHLYLPTEKTTKVSRHISIHFTYIYEYKYKKVKNLSEVWRFFILPTGVGEVYEKDQGTRLTKMHDLFWNMATFEIKNAYLSIIIFKCIQSLSNFASYSGSVNGKSYSYSRSVWKSPLTNIPQSLAYSLSKGGTRNQCDRRKMILWRGNFTRNAQSQSLRELKWWVGQWGFFNILTKKTANDSDNWTLCQCLRRLIEVKPKVKNSDIFVQ